MTAGKKMIHNTGPYTGPKICQARANTEIDGRWCTIGSWIIGDQPAGMIVREDDTPIIVANSRIVPHLILGE